MFLLIVIVGLKSSLSAKFKFEPMICCKNVMDVTPLIF